MQNARKAFASTLAGALVLAGATSAHAQQSALDPARAAVRSSPADWHASLALGRALRRAGKFTEALTELRRGAATLAGRQPEAAIKLHWEEARTYIGERNFSQAMVACRVVGAQTGGTADGHACAAEAHLLWRRATEALTEVQLALAGGNKQYDAKVSQGRALALQLKDADAEAAFRQAMTFDPSGADAHMYLGRFLVDTNKTDAGIAELKQAVTLDPNGPDAAYELGRAIGSGADAITALERATRERPLFLDAWVKLAEVDLASNKNAEAHAAAASALRINPQDAAAHVVVGRVAAAEGKADDAMTEARAALGIMANSAGAKLLLADAYALKGDIDLALEQYQASYGLDRLNPDTLVHAAHACIKANRLTSARAYGAQVTKEFPTWGPGWVALGDALAGDHDAAGARAAYDKALQSKGPVDATAVRAKLSALH